jgi:hypothetical protein
MPSLPPSPSGGIALTYGACVRTIGTTFTVIGLPHGTNNPGDIVPPRILSPDDFVVVSFDNIVTLLPPSATCWGSMIPPTSLEQPSEHSPCHSVIFGSMGGEYTPTAQPTMPLDGAPQTSCLSNLARPSLPACATHIFCRRITPLHLHQLDRRDALPPTLCSWCGSTPPQRHTLPMLLTEGSSIWHTTCPPWDMLMHIHGGWMPSTLSPSSYSIGINDTPFIDTWHGKPGIPLPPQQSSAGNSASG